MSTVQTTASPRAPRGKPQSPAQAAHVNAGRQSQRKPRGNRAHNGYNQNQHNAAGASPSKMPAELAHAEGASHSGEDAHMPSGPRNMRKPNQSHPSIDRVFSPPESEPVPINPSATPAKIQAAYAGPTFHASPAPSALPIPKFLSRSVPAKTRAGPPTPPPEDSSDSASPSPSASPSRAPVAVPPRNEQSPLDLLFKADAAERAKGNHGRPASHGPFNPMDTSRPQHLKHDSSHSMNGVFPIELDGESKHAHMSPPPAASPASHRSVTDPTKIPQLKDMQQQGNGNDVMNDLLNRLSMSQKKPSATPPRPDAQGPQGFMIGQTPSPFHDGRPPQNPSGPTTPQAPPPNQDSEFFYGNRNLSPLFKAAKGDSAKKRNSGLRTEISAESPMVGPGNFQSFPSVPPTQMMDPNAFSRDQPGNGNGGFANGPRPSAPHVQSYQQSPNNRRKTPGRQPQQPQQPRPDTYQKRGNMSGTGNTAANAPPASAPKAPTSMMSFVPSSVAAKQRKTSAPAATAGASPMKTATPSNTLSLEQDLKRLLNLSPAGESSVR
ncbi:uncharacterized protein J4E92_008035 [Alternaria infectoria]|uniref:uncharacterized protein n=1 Tax=Alternaria triticimaculans TaxID=297637 RepID=UPI0020C3B113|nr:uncharacterized protein J4E78_003884 [Alternaria triticimaculans]XP_051350641.1 uncharacterized protein J4E92_008035 [Alternaria infectoria]KAI4663469.1 hypothetical protein J4E78_003884 [Alternaria triticimaculans]KAI4923278.1 hypothetical protein J4E92_008035 [Alternaria infectoria]